MYELIMNELGLLIKTIIERARRKGFDILLLTFGMAAMVWWNFQLEAKREALIIKYDGRLDRLNTEWSAALNEANERIRECEQDKFDLALRVGILEMKNKTVNKKDK